MESKILVIDSMWQNALSHALILTFFRLFLYRNTVQNFGPALVSQDLQGSRLTEEVPLRNLTLRHLCSVVEFCLRLI